eukprot:c44746_g1_i1 orf=25-246(+)
MHTFFPKQMGNETVNVVRQDREKENAEIEFSPGAITIWKADAGNQVSKQVGLSVSENKWPESRELEDQTQSLD